MFCVNTTMEPNSIMSFIPVNNNYDGFTENRILIFRKRKTFMLDIFSVICDAELTLRL